MLTRVTQGGLPQKARFYAGLRAVFGGVTQVTLKNTVLYTEKNILQSLYNISQSFIKKVSRVRELKK